MDYKKLIAEMTLEEKASLCSGRDFWHTKSVERLGIPEVMVSDGPHGLRKQPAKQDHLGNFESIQAVCFPSACAAAASFDKELLYQMGQALGTECQAEGIDTLLGPAVNIKRSPLCGRNFEYYSEDPLVSSELAAAYIQGVQSKNVGTSIKHFLANNQETRRFTVSAEVDERTLREIYLAAFEGAVQKAKPWTVMSSLNRVNGTFVSENPTYLTEILREEWGFDGIVMSDWNAVNDRVKSLEAGLDLEMPGSYGINDKEIVAAVNNGQLPITALDKAVKRILRWIDCCVSHRNTNAVWNKEADHQLAGKIEEESAVLLKNEDQILPLSETDNIAVIGVFAKQPRYQGGGSSHINAYKVTSFLDAAKENGRAFAYADGYTLETETVDQTLLEEAIQIAKSSNTAIIFAGLPESFESEGYDRTHIQLPHNQNVLIEEVRKVQPNVVVVLHNGSAVEMPWANHVKGIFEMYLGGQNVGTAAYRLIFGKVNPSGKLPETFPVKLSDNPSYLHFPGDVRRVAYAEGVFVGYRYYDTKQMDVLFPFGHGLSYTNYAYSNLKLSSQNIKDGDILTVSVDVSNTGNRAGKEIVQLYVSAPRNGLSRPLHELRGFEKVALEPNETKTVTFTLNRRAFSYWDTEFHCWAVDSGDYSIAIGASSRDIRCTDTVNIVSVVRPLVINENTCFGDLMEQKEFAEATVPLISSLLHLETTDAEAYHNAVNSKTAQDLLRFSPLRGLFGFGDGRYDHEILAVAIAQLQQIADTKQKIQEGI